LRRWSPVYLSPPQGFVSQNWFLNLVAEIKTSLSPWALLFYLWRIEFSCGRKRKGGLSDRTLDLDLIFYDHLVVESPVLRLPHPRFSERDFVLKPLLDLIPVKGKTRGRLEVLFRKLKKRQIFFFTFIEP
jgi:2-amino-4-hydroxy-6-hydroxymethyldihydropteridine diphosphokinase